MIRPKSSVERKLWARSATYGRIRKTSSHSAGGRTSTAVSHRRFEASLSKKAMVQNQRLFPALYLVPELVILLALLDVLPEIEALVHLVHACHDGLLEVLGHVIRGLGVGDVVVGHLGDERLRLGLGHV